jgi:hypothetical protein
MAEYKPGDEVRNSGIYRVAHDTQHTAEHEVTCVSTARNSATQPLTLEMFIVLNMLCR